MNAPSNGNIHRYPVDCWRFYPDSGQALITWAQRNGINAVQLESYTSSQTDGSDGFWNDFVGIFLKDKNLISDFPFRILDKKKDVLNALVYGNDKFINQSELPEDRIKFLKKSMFFTTHISTNRK